MVSQHYYTLIIIVNNNLNVLISAGINRAVVTFVESFCFIENNVLCFG